MSRANIIGQQYDPETGQLFLTFRVHPSGQRTYLYTGFDALAILRGDDPADYEGERVE